MMRRTSRTVLGILDQAGPVLIRASEDADEASSQDMAVLGSVVTYGEGLGVQFGSVATEDFRIGFNRHAQTLKVNHSGLQIVHFAVQMLVGPSELAIIAAANTAHDKLRRALIEYAAVTYDNVYVMATPCFWRLHPHELLVMQLLLYSLPTSSTTAQVPLHLPHSAANEPWSMLMTTLTAGTHSCWYCDEIAAVLVTPFESTINESPDVHVVYSVPNVSSLIPGCRLIVLTKGQTALAPAQPQALVQKILDSLKQPVLQRGLKRGQTGSMQERSGGGNWGVMQGPSHYGNQEVISHSIALKRAYRAWFIWLAG
ncbi:hypothetical protein ABBQ38_002667 [Trebouxia sp. C0009 RCD-2024]